MPRFYSDPASDIRPRTMSALPPNADMCSATAHVCFGPKADVAPSSDTTKETAYRALQVQGHVRFALSGRGSDVFMISSWPSSSSGTKPLPPHVGHRCSSSAPFSTTRSPLQSGQVFMCASCPCYQIPADGGRGHGRHDANGSVIRW